MDASALNAAAMTERLIDAAIYYEQCDLPYRDSARKELSEARSAIEAALASAPAPASGGVDAVAVSRMDVVIALREWFGGERYARDYEYLDMQMGPQMKATLEAVFKDRRERASLSPAATPVSEVEGEVVFPSDGELASMEHTDSFNAFEGWARNSGLPLYMAESGLGRFYGDDRTEWAWQSWCALAKPASSPAGVAEIVAKMRADMEKLGGFENGLLAVPADGIRSYIEQLEDALSQSTSARRVGE